MDTFLLTGDAVTGIDPHPRVLSLLDSGQLPVRVRLGRNTPASRPLSLNLANYVDKRMIAALPKEFSWTAAAEDVIANSLLNTELGDCVIASLYHIIATALGNKTPAATRTPTPSEVRQVYTSFCGPGDNGCFMPDVNNLAASKGVPIQGVIHKLDGWVSADWNNPDMVKSAILLFCHGKFGMNLPNAWLNSAVWDVVTSSIAGGHDVPGLGWNEQGVTVPSWGRKYLLTWRAIQDKHWVEEFYVLLLQDWYGLDNLSPNGFKKDELANDLALIGQNHLPPIAPAPPVPVTPGTLPGRVIPPIGFKYDDVQVSLAAFQFPDGQATFNGPFPGSASRRR